MTATPPDFVDETPSVPSEIWVFGWSFVAEGALQLLVRGAKGDAVSAVAGLLGGLAAVPNAEQGFEVRASRSPTSP